MPHVDAVGSRERAIWSRFRSAYLSSKIQDVAWFSSFPGLVGDAFISLEVFSRVPTFIHDKKKFAKTRWIPAKKKTSNESQSSGVFWGGDQLKPQVAGGKITEWFACHFRPGVCTGPKLWQDLLLDVCSFFSWEKMLLGMQGQWKFSRFFEMMHTFF